MRNAGEVLEAVDRLYAAVTTGAWSSALEAITDVLHGDHAFLHVGRPDGNGGGLMVTARVSPGDLARMLSPEAVRIAQPIQHALPCGLFDRRALIPDVEFTRSPYYNELIRPMGGFHAISAKQPSSGGFLFAACRGPARGAYESSDLAQLARLAPHFATALGLRQRLQAAEGASIGLAGMLDRLQTGAILTDAWSRPSFINSRAWQVLAEADGLLLRGRGLAAPLPTATRRLRAAIAAAGGMVGRKNGKLDHAPSLATGTAHRLSLPRPSQRPPLSVTVLPISPLGMSLPGVRPAQVAVFVTKPDSPPRIDRVALADAFRLTRRESETVVLLAEGLNLDQIAAALEISVSSVRQYFKRAFDKTGTHSQAALVALARGFVEP